MKFPRPVVSIKRPAGKCLARDARQFQVSDPGIVAEPFHRNSSQVGEMTYVGFAPRGTPAAALAALRAGFEGASNDPEFINDAIKRNGVPFTYVSVPRGQAIFRSLADVTPAVLTTLKASIAATAPN